MQPCLPNYTQRLSRRHAQPAVAQQPTGVALGKLAPRLGRVGAERRCSVRTRAAVLQDASPSRSPARTSSRSPSRASEHAFCSRTAVLRFFEALNTRDISSLLNVLSDDIVHQDLAHESAGTGKLEVAKFYLELFASLAPNMKFVVEDVTGGNSPCVGVTWHIAVEGQELPISKGLGFYKFSSQKICFIRQSPEHFVKVAPLMLSATGMASPFVNALGPVATPSFWTNMMDVATSTLSGPQPLDNVQQLLRGSMDSAFLGLLPPQQPDNSSLGTTHARAGPSGPLVSGPSPSLGGAPRALPAVSPMVPAVFPGAAQAVASAPLGGVEVAPRMPSGGAGAGAAATGASAMGGVVDAADTPSSGQHVAQTARPSAPITAEQLARALTVAAAAAASAPQDTGVLNSNAAAAESDAGAAGATGTVSNIVPAPNRGGQRSPKASSPRLVSPELPGVCAPVGSASPVADLGAALSTAQAPCAAQAATVAAEQIAADGGSGRLASAALSAAPLAAEACPAATPVNLTGIWSKVPELSDSESYEKALDLWEINGMQRATARLIEGLEVHQQGSHFDVHHLTVIPYFKVTERYNLSKQSKVMRRDLRQGQATATAALLEDQRGVRLDVTFGAPFPGRLVEVYQSPEPGVMHVVSTVHLRDQSVSTTQVYRLQGGMTKAEFLRQSEKRNGKPADILRKLGAPL